MAKAPKKNKRFSGHSQDAKMAQALDDLDDFEQYRRDVLPLLRRAIKEKWSPEKIYKEMSAYTAARAVTIALTDPDAGKALSAIKETLDRSQGKAVERKEVKTSIAALSDDELDALIKSEQEVDKLN